MTKIRLGAAALLALLLCACSTAPKYVRPDAGYPQEYQAREQVAPATPPARTQESPAAEAVNRDWWRNFHSEALPLLQATALQNNHNFAATRWELAQALSRARASRSELLPSLDLKGSASRRGSGGSGGYQVSDAVGGTVQASYELDIWGKNADSTASSAYKALASLNAWRGAGLSLESEVALTYFSWLACKENLAVYDSMLQNARAILSYMEKRQTHGAAAPLDVARQRASVKSMEAERVAYELKLEQAHNDLCQLLGATSLPAGAAALMAKESMRALAAPAVRPGLPSELLARRPDIAEAEAGLQSANADIGVARSAFLPSITLTAAAGYESDALHALISPASALYSLAGSILAPIFNNGKHIAELDQAKASERELAERYRETTLNAFWEVSTALSANTLLQTQERHRQQAARQAAEAYRIARVRYEQGAEDFLAVLNAQDTVLSTDNSLVQNRLERLNSAVALFKALGGGWGSEGDLEHMRKEFETAPLLTL